MLHPSVSISVANTAANIAIAIGTTGASASVHPNQPSATVRHPQQPAATIQTTAPPPSRPPPTPMRSPLTPTPTPTPTPVFSPPTHSPPSVANAVEVTKNPWRPLPGVPTPRETVTIVCVGNGEFGRKNFRGKPTGLATRFRKLVQRADRADRLVLVSVDERWTSRVCSKCGHQSCQPMLLNSTSKLHPVTTCSTCSSVWQRDINAARNIRALALMSINGDPRPIVLDQKVDASSLAAAASPTRAETDH
ncbi:hypothetical protein DM01DRAFT_1406162 [Hesseltinella vesiculosa]|uniref:Cas12f1-like TNB domain-containing protein n=1 Tax=Hesseltinella vesiculosa TaxID=101127 RepID=A0A1X2GNJ1_9FUNG|nr:hypothetical protein DM01DRAFT_1406162 [Hesseltinella vesiculosa]